jgi:hypothetical protein
MPACLLRSLLADPDRIGLACVAEHVSTDIDVVTAGREILTG